MSKTCFFIGMKAEISFTRYIIFYIKRSSQSITDEIAHWSCAHLRLIFLIFTQDTNQPAKCTKWEVTHILPKEVPIETNGFIKHIQNKNQVARLKFQYIKNNNNILGCDLECYKKWRYHPKLYLFILQF